MPHVRKLPRGFAAAVPQGAWPYLVLASALLLGGRAYAQEDSGATPSLPASSDTVLPRTGIDPGLSDLREHLLRSYGDTQPTPAEHGPNLQITGQFGASEEYTDNVGLTAGGGQNRGDDFITNLMPGITIVDTSQRLQVNLDYRPIGQIYAKNGDFSQLQQQFTGDILVTALPNWLYIDLRGSVSQQAVYGGLGPSSTVTLSPGNRQTASNVSFSPYVSRTLGSNGTLEFGAGYIYSATDSPVQPGQAGQPASALNGFGAYGSSFLATKRVFADFTTGEDLGRLRNKVGTDDNFYDGAGALAGGRRILLTDDASYAVNRLVTVLGEIGYEDLSYPRSDYAYSGPIGSGGVKLTPNRGSSLTLEYRYVDGFGSVYVQGSVQATPRIRVFGGYSAGISTFEQDQQNALLDGSDDATGAAASVLQAAPLLQGTNAFGANQNLNKLHRLDASASYLGNYDTLTLSVQRETTNPVGRQVGGFAPVRTSGTFGSITEKHDLTPLLSLTGFVQYGTNSTGLRTGGLNGASPGNGDSGDTISVSIGLDRIFTETLTGYVRFGGTYVVGGSAFAASGFQGLSGNDTTFTIGGLKKF